jgi:chromosome segregation and condensation protein ScpB
MNPLTAAEIGVFLGVTSAAVRQVVKRKEIQSVGKDGRAHLYDVDEVLRHTGVHDRRVLPDKPERVSQ